VFIAEDQPLLRKGLRSLLESHADLLVCGEAGDRAGVTRGVTKSNPDVVVMELFLGLENTFDLVKRFSSQRQPVQVVVLSRHDELVYAMPSFKAGARAFVLKNEDSKHVVDSIRTVHRGNMRFSEAVNAQFLDRYAAQRTDGQRAGRASLSPRELEVIGLIAEGLTSREIAVRLQISVKTIEAHRAHIKQKANLESGTALVRYSLTVANQVEAMAV
jgi:DNA-binding NarL/FixJ family response regulator